MLLADLGANVLTVAREAGNPEGPRRARKYQIQLRGRVGTIALDLKSPSARETIDALVSRADVLMEGHRPEAMRRLDLHAERCLQLNPRLIYTQMTGWGQTGPWSQLAGHDINYLAASGLLGVIGKAGQAPTVPLNLVADYGGGSMLAAFGIACALYERERSGKGQAIDVAMTDGAALLGVAVFGAWAAGDWRKERGSNLLDGGAPWYDVYETSDGRFMAVGALEEKFYRNLVEGLGLDGDALPARADRAHWPRLRELFECSFKQRSLAQWISAFESLDACVTPVLTPAEAVRHPQATSRAAFVERDGVVQPAPAPRFSRTSARLRDGCDELNLEDW